jgi:hypothetical protein
VLRAVAHLLSNPRRARAFLLCRAMLDGSVRTRRMAQDARPCSVHGRVWRGSRETWSIPRHEFALRLRGYLMSTTLSFAKTPY